MKLGIQIPEQEETAERTIGKESERSGVFEVDAAVGHFEGASSWSLPDGNGVLVRALGCLAARRSACSSSTPSKRKGVWFGFSKSPGDVVLSAPTSC
jgi:hypothetical protein